MNIGDTYIIRIEVSEGRIFTYTGKIISEDEHFVTIIDKYNQQHSFNKNKIVSMELEK